MVTLEDIAKSAQYVTVKVLHEIPDDWVSVCVKPREPSVVHSHLRKPHVGPIYTKEHPYDMIVVPDECGFATIKAPKKWIRICVINQKV